MHTGPLFIIVNHKKFDHGITSRMSAHAIARLVDFSAETSIVRQDREGQLGHPLSGEIDVHEGEHFVVTRAEPLFIFVNGKKFDHGIAPRMSAAAIAQLVGMSAKDSIVREDPEGHPGTPLTGEIDVHQGERFLVIHIELFILVNRKKFEDGITPRMSVDAIARLVGLTADNSIVRKEVDGHPGDPLTGEIHVHKGEQFLVTRKNVEGGHEGVRLRIEGELERLREGGQKITFIEAPQAVVFHDLPSSAKNAPATATDVLVMLPPGYPASMLDHAWLPERSVFINRVKGAPQQISDMGGRRWQQISYHPHGNGGGPPWNPNRHGLHTYFDELLTWLAGIA